MGNCSLSPIQEKLLEMLKWFHGFCIENGLRYYIAGGTMLGAVRHQGFIPWDDDVDVGLPRRDYEKLQSLMSKLDTLPYVMETPHSDAKEYCYAYSKIYDTRTTLIENKRFPVKRGVFLDVFPLDGLGNDSQRGRDHHKSILRLYHIYTAWTCNIRRGRKFYKNMAVRLLKLVPSWIFNAKKLSRKLDCLCAKYDFDSSENVGWLVGAYGLKECMPRELFGKPTLYAFEDAMICGPEDYEGYLTHIYGDWRKLPPEDKRITTHDYILLDLKKSYLD